MTVEPLGLALSVIIPASNEEAWIGSCLQALFQSDPLAGGAEVIVVANGCRDHTADIARATPVPLGWRMQVLELPIGSKPAAMRAGEAIAQGQGLVWLDADCKVSPRVMAQISQALGGDVAIYVGATPVIPKAQSWVSRAYARFWQKLPFAQSPAPGYGLYATNRLGRARWADVPSIISDDTFVRLQFAPNERLQVPAVYTWPITEGFAALVKVRRRQDAGLYEIRQLHPHLIQSEGKERLTFFGLLEITLRDPIGFLVYGAVSLAVRARRGGQDFSRGR